MSVKKELYKKCLSFIDNRLLTIQNTISEIQESLVSETKSSAGDKHETGRAMLQLEREKAGHQLAEAQKTQGILQKINPNTTHQHIVLGSVVYTTKQNYYIAISAGEIEIDNTVFYAISPFTPIAKVLLGKEKNTTISFRSSTFVISKVL